MKIYINTFTGSAGTYKFDVDPSTTIGQLKEIFCERTKCQEDLPILCLAIDGEQLEEDDKSLQDYKLADESILDAICLGEVYRSGFKFSGSRFVDVTKGEGLERREWSKKAPAWRRTIRGLCLEGICSTKGCAANGEYVIMRIGYKKFDILCDPDENTTTCPMCKNYVEPITCAFNNCWWRYEGIKEPERGSGKPPEKVRSTEWNSADDAYHRFEEETSGVANWRRLVFEAVKEKPE